MALGTIATIATIAAAATSIAGAAYAATSSGPKMPDSASSSQKVADAQAALLPSQLRLQQLQQQGGKGTVNMPAHMKPMKVVEVTTGTKIDKGNTILGQNLAGVDPAGSIFFGLGKRNKDVRQVVPYVESEWEPGGKYYDQRENGEVPWYWQNEPVAAGPEEFDFTGYGTADIEGDAARRQADLELELGRKYGTQFAESGRQLAEQADPLGTQARALEYELLHKDMPVSPLAGMLNDQITSEVQAGRGLDPMSQDLLEAAVAKSNAARGDQASAGSVAESMSTGAEGQARLEAALRKSGAFQSSGQTPEDIEFRRNQQQISNLGAFVNGATPESQFGNISQANRGATPVTGAQTNATLPTNAGLVGQNYANQGYAANAQRAMQPNSWFTGISALMNGIGALKTGSG